VVGILLENGAGLEDRTYAMNFAGDLGYWKLVKLFLGTGQVANCRTLFNSVHYGDEAMVQLLLEAGVDPLQDDFENPLHLAIERGYERIVRWLVEAGADMNAQWGYGRNQRNALTVAKLHGREQIIQLLAEHGAH
jgi:ankyrin repeat protein